MNVVDKLHMEIILIKEVVLTLKKCLEEGMWFSGWISLMLV